MLFFKKVFIDTQFKNWANSVTFCIGYRCLEGFDRLCGQSTLHLHLAHLLILAFVWHQGICSGAASPAPFLPWPCPFTVTHLCISWFWLLINHLIFYIWYHYFFLIKHLFFGHAPQLERFQFSNQGSNPSHSNESQNPNHQATRELSDKALFNVSIYHPNSKVCYDRGRETVSMYSKHLVLANIGDTEMQKR